VANFARSKPESWADALWLMMASFAMLLLIYVVGCSVIVEFAYRHLGAAPFEWLMVRLGLRERKINYDLPAVWPADPNRTHGSRGPSQ
jgi:hypothetical protein